MSFPASLPSYILTSGNDTANGAAGGAGLSPLLNAFEADITALGAKVGTGSSTATSGKVLRATGTGTSAWGQVVMATDVAAFSSADIRGVVSDETGTGSLVFGSSPTILTPTIASFANATHTHANSAGGGVLTALALGTDSSWAWTTYVAALGGWAATPTQTCRYIQVGKTIHMQVTVSGTSNATTATVSLPFTSSASNSVSFFAWTTSSVDAIAVVSVGTGVTSVSVPRGWQTGGTVAGTLFSAWTASGTKNLTLMFTYEAA